jgi:hypothetical protein
MTDTTFPICATCAVEHADRPEVCAICADERQWVPAAGQRWTSLAELAADGRKVSISELEPALYGLTCSPGVGIGQQAKLVRTPRGNLLWDPIGFLDDAAVAAVRELGPVLAIAASHPHMFGAQVAWSHALDGAAVYVNEQQLAWLARPDAVVRSWEKTCEPVPGVTLRELGGHFPGSAVARFQGRDGAGVVLSSDTVFVNPDRATVAFMRSFPNHIQLSPAVVRRLAAALGEEPYERIYGNFDNAVDSGAAAAVQRSAERHVAWVEGRFDDLT